MIALTVGMAGAALLAIAARFTRFDIDRSYYATLLIVIASYYVLFAFMGEEAIVPEIITALAFTGIAVFGAYRLPLLIGLGILLHGVFDLLHPQLIQNRGVPDWWPALCGGFDIVMGVWVIYLAKTGKALTTRGGLS